ncbi:MAG: hypothetical protein ACKPKO_56005, partial [Candidatus Fonsibacter sp.]
RSIFRRGTPKYRPLKDLEKGRPAALVVSPYAPTGYIKEIFSQVWVLTRPISMVSLAYHS